MCHLVREHTAAAAETGVTPPSVDRVRTRWIGAVTAALLGGFAMAALDAPTPAAPPVQAREPAIAVPFAASTSVISPAALQQGTMPVDDGVPSATDVAKAHAGDCHHGL